MTEDIVEELKETHLPMLEEVGVIEWDRETDVVSKGPNFEQIVEAMRLME